MVRYSKGSKDNVVKQTVAKFKSQIKHPKIFAQNCNLIWKEINKLHIEKFAINNLFAQNLFIRESTIKYEKKLCLTVYKYLYYLRFSTATAQHTPHIWI